MKKEEVFQELQVKLNDLMSTFVMTSKQVGCVVDGVENNEGVQFSGEFEQDAGPKGKP